MSDYQISLMQLAEVREAAKVLSRAMLDNPLHQAVLLGAGEEQRREIEDMFFGLFNELPGTVFLAKEKGKTVGVMRMKSCRGEPTGQGPAAPQDEKDIEWRKSVWHREWGGRDPLTQHWHLGPVGVLPSHQGLGVGSMLLERFCQEVDACRAEAYLETDKAENVRFYEKFGFKTLAEAEIFGVKNSFMLRPAVS